MNRKKKSLLNIIAAAMLIVISVSSCITVKEYQKNKLNDGEMSLSNRKVEKTELSFQTYREGAAGANGSKKSGGCGCN